MKLRIKFKSNLKSHFLLIWLLGVTLFMASSNWSFAEDWKSQKEESEFTFGALPGLGVVDNSVGFALIGTASKKIIQDGFVPDISNNVSIEGQVGPVFISGTTAWFYGIHLRWDFIKDTHWIFYGLGGLGGDIYSLASVSHFELFPRFGAGAIWRADPRLWVRFELSHELTALGLLFPF